MEDKSKKPKKSKKLTGVMAEIENISPAGFARQQYSGARGAGATRGQAIKQSIAKYNETSEAMRTLRTGKKGGVGDFFKSAGFENLGILTGALFDRGASKEEIQEARKTLGLEDEEKAKKEPQKKEVGLSKSDRKKIDYIVKTADETNKKLQDIQDAINSIGGSVKYVADRISPRIVEAKEKSGKGKQFVQFDPLSPMGEQFRQISEGGKVSAIKPGKDYIKSATMRAALAPSASMAAPQKTGKVSRFKDPTEKSFTEEFKKDPVLLLRNDMNANFEKVFKLFEEQKESMQNCGSGGGLGLDDLLGVAGGAAAAARRKPKAPKPKPKAPKPKGAIARTAARVGGAVAAGAATAGAAIKTGAGKVAQKVGGTAVGKAATKAAEKVGDVKSRTWTRFLKFMEKVAPKLYKKIATRLATAGGLALIPGAGWIGSAITVLGSAWLAYDVYQLWSEFTDMSEEEQAEFDEEVKTSGDKRGMEIPSQSGAVEGAPGGTKVIPSQSGAMEGVPGGTSFIPSQSKVGEGAPLVLRSSGNSFAKQESTPTGAPSVDQPNFGITPAIPEYNVEAKAGPGISPDIRPVPQKKIADSEGKKAVINALDKRGVTDPMARAAIMAQIAHESAGFTRLSENLKYSSGRLQEVFSYYKANPEQARSDAGNEVAIGSRAYGNRLGNGPPETGEGYEYRGRGFIQLTGKQNYNRFGINNPDELLNPAKAAENAVDYMMGYKGNWSDIQSVTRYVNGNAMRGLDERSSYFTSFVNDPEITGMGVVEGAGGPGQTTMGELAAAPAGGGGMTAPSAGGTAAAPSTGTAPSAGGGATGGTAAASGGSAAAVSAEKALVDSGLARPSPGGTEIPAAPATAAATAGGLGDQSITKEQTNALLGIAAQNKAAKEGISIEEAKSKLDVGGGLGDQSVTKEQTNTLMGIIAQNRAKTQGISVEQAKSQLAFAPKASVEPVQTVSGQGMDTGSKLLEFGKSALSTVATVAPMIMGGGGQSTAGKVQQGVNVLSALGEAATRSSESAFSRALAKDFSHPTAFTTMGTI